SQKLKSIVAVSIGLRLFLMGFAPNVANPIKYTPTCPDTPLKTGKLQIQDIFRVLLLYKKTPFKD
ncbi:MAG: hypothetical protein Q8Q50_10795, partial [Methylobacter sp.]|nr:hypothetical protein [Methylobacter sp.]